MSDINCASCDELRQVAPLLAVEGINDTMCASLQNDTGLSPSSGNNDKTDMDNLADCAVGRMAQEIKAYDVCDWKEYMKKLVPNIHDNLKAINCVDAGQWTNIHDLDSRVDLLCQSFDNMMGLIRGNDPKSHDGVFLDSFLNKVGGHYNPSASYDPTPTKERFVPVFQADMLAGNGCTEGKKLGRWSLTWGWRDPHYPYIWSWSVDSAIQENEIIGYIPRSAVPDSDMPLSVWKDILRGGSLHEMGFFGSPTTHVYWTVRGYTIINGVEFNKNLEEYGEDTAVVFFGPLIGTSRQGGFNGAIHKIINSYDA